jgi:hypothetical protein
VEPGWAVDLIGDLADLSELRELTFPPQTELAIDGDLYYIRLLIPAAGDDPWNVQRLAEEAMKVVNGTARLYVEGWRNVKCGGPVHFDADGRRNLFALVHGMNFTSRMGTPTVTVTDAAGNVVHPPAIAKPAHKAISTANRDPAVKKVLGMYNSANLDYRDLYVIYEVVEADVGGIDAVAALSESPKADLKRFKHTANSVAVLGEDTDALEALRVIEANRCSRQMAMPAWRVGMSVSRPRK